eukprot:4964415-Prymnesium_polylepis.1
MTAPRLAHGRHSQPQATGTGTASALPVPVPPSSIPPIECAMGNGLGGWLVTLEEFSGGGGASAASIVYP